MPTIKGTPVAPGLAVGHAHVVRARPDTVPVWTIRSDEVPSEIARLNAALEEASSQLQLQQEIVRDASGEQDAGIFAVHRLILEDPSALSSVEAKISEERINAEAAVQNLIDRLQSAMGGLEEDKVRRYAADVSDPWRAVLDILLQREQESITSTVERVVLAATELTPQVVTFLPRDRVLAVITESGGRFSHGAVLARSFGFPCVVGLDNLLARLEQGLQVLVDGDTGTVQLRPDPEAIDAFLEQSRRRVERREVLEAHAELPAVTPDGHSMEVGVNMESLYDLGTFNVDHCDGVGLLRTEFLYMERTQFPSEEEQFRLYRRMVEALDGRPVTLRTLDIGGDKQLPYFSTPKEANPQLGWRGIRISLEWQDLLRVQLRAALRASPHGNLRILLPMVTSLEEVRAVREIFERVRTQLIEQGYEIARDVPVGIMIEVPSTIWVLDRIIQEVDFVSVGTNDLTQYLLAVDRDNALVAKIYEPYHPAVIRALAEIARITNETGKPCGVCGEIAGDEAVAVLLLGMGYDHLSVAPSFLAGVRYAIRNTTIAQAQAQVRQALDAGTAEEVQVLAREIRDRVHRRLLEDKASISNEAEGA